MFVFFEALVLELSPTQAGLDNGQLKDKSFIKTSSNSMVKLKKSIQTNITGNTSKVLNLFKVHSFSRNKSHVVLLFSSFTMVVVEKAVRELPIDRNNTMFLKI